MAGSAPSVTVVPSPRRPLEDGGQVRRWYEDWLGWPTAPGTPVALRTGVRFDVLDVPLEAGRAGLRHLVPASPVAVQGGRMKVLLAPGSADEVPGVLEWLEWGALALDLAVIGEGGLMDAPPPPGTAASGGPAGPSGRLSAAGTVRGGEPGPAGRTAPPANGRGAHRGAAVWLRPPVPGDGDDLPLPALAAPGGGGGAPDLVRLLDTVAVRCHRLRLRRRAAPSARP